MQRIRFWLPHLAAAVLVVLCGRLAVWQLDRAEVKEERLTRWHEAPAVALNEVETAPLFSAVTATGRFDAERHVLLDNQIRNNHAGVHVFTPFVLQGSEQIFMVNRGWLPWDRRSGEGKPFDTSTDNMTITGRLSDAPRVGLQLGEAAPLDPDRWPNLMTYYDISRIRDALGPAVADTVLLLEPEHPAHLTGDNWPAVNMGPERHLGYAFQWASIGTAIVVLWLILTYRSFRKQ
jgi:cytochrome oxidase assembly protein ShyY1